MKAASCDRTRALLAAGDGRTARPEAVRHLAECDACAEFAARLGLAVEALRSHRTPVTPPPGFATRVAAALPAADQDLVGRAALRLLPATLALALALGAWCWTQTSSPDALLEAASTGDLLVWVLDDEVLSDGGSP